MWIKSILCRPIPKGRFIMFILWMDCIPCYCEYVVICVSRVANISNFNCGGGPSALPGVLFCPTMSIVTLAKQKSCVARKKWRKGAALVISGFTEHRTTMFFHVATLIAKFKGPMRGPSGAGRSQVGPMLAPWTLLSGKWSARIQGTIWCYIMSICRFVSS